MTTDAGMPPAGTPPTGMPPAGTPPTGTPPAGTPPAGTPPAGEWHGYTDPADVAYVANKGWKAPQDAIKSYRQAEGLIGRDPNTLLVLPRADDPAGLRAALGKLGLPETADKYELDVPKGATPNEAFKKWAATTFHKVGLLPGQAKELSAAHNAYLAEQATALENDYKTKVTADKQALLKEWGGGHERMLNVAKAAAGALGFTGEMVDALEQQVGYAATMKFFAGLGQKMSEDQLVTGGEKKQNFDGALLTPAEAKTQWEQMKLDPNMVAALSNKSHPGHAEATRKKTSLFQIMFPEG